MNTPHDFILFDLDGTLSDPLLGIGRSINFALAHFGYPERELDDLKPCIGPPLDQSFAALTGTTSPAHLTELVVKYRERYAEIGYAENVIYAGIADALAQLHGHGLKLAVCTSKRADFAERILEMFDIHPYFEFVSGGEIGTHKWQQMAGLLAQNRVSKASLMVGDRYFDMQAASRNGLAAAGVLWGFGSAEELAAEQPRYLLHEPGELFPVLAG
ncbi:MAG: haloacid dehalogenase superfamily enzyme, subfamily [Proteobacteria bacterium]|nr:haloacid dehalogenase superfamily enzyme, subfamily [Pseudomonadota bacterium]